MSLNRLGFSLVYKRVSNFLKIVPHGSYHYQKYPFSSSNSISNEWSTNTISFANETEYHLEADRVIGVVLDGCEKIIDLLDEDNSEFDYKYADGVVNIEFGSDIGTFVLNKQTPNKQLWLSSPISGPSRYDFNFDEKKWICNKDGSTSLKELLQTQFAEIVQESIQFDEEF